VIHRRRLLRCYPVAIIILISLTVITCCVAVLANAKREGAAISAQTAMIMSRPGIDGDAPPPVQDKTDAEIAQLLIGTWSFDAGGGVHTAGVISYKADATFRAKWTIDVGGNSWTREESGTWTVLQGIVSTASRNQIKEDFETEAVIGGFRPIFTDDNTINNKVRPRTYRLDKRVRE